MAGKKQDCEVTLGFYPVEITLQAWFLLLPELASPHQTTLEGKEKKQNPK